MTVRRFSHVGLCVSDLDRSLAFYRDALGFAERKRLDAAGDAAERLLGLHDLDLRAVLLERDGVRLELLHYVSPGHRGSGEPRPINALGLSHLSLRVEDLDAAVAGVVSAGGHALAATRTRDPATGAGAIFVADPDGTRIELIQGPPETPSRGSR